MDEKKTATNFRNDTLMLHITDEGEGSNSIAWHGLNGRFKATVLYCDSAENARSLFTALQAVIGVWEK